MCTAESAAVIMSHRMGVTQKERELPFAGSLYSWLQMLGLCLTEAKLQKLHSGLLHGWHRAWAVFVGFPGTLAGLWIGNGAAGNPAESHRRHRHHGQWLNTLNHSFSPARLLKAQVTGPHLWFRSSGMGSKNLLSYSFPWGCMSEPDMHASFWTWSFMYNL